MPIKKYTSFEEASKDLWVLHPDDQYYKKLKELFVFWNKLNSSKKPIKKIQKFKDISEKRLKKYEKNS